MKGNDKHQQHPAGAGKKRRFSWRRFLGLEAVPKDPTGVDRFSTEQYVRMTARMARLALLSFWRRHRLASRLLALLLVGLILFQLVSQVIDSRRVIVSYEIPDSAQKLLPRPIKQFEPLIKAKESGGLIYNEGYKLGSDYAGDSATPQMTAEFSADRQPTASFTDPVTGQTLGFKAKYGVEAPKKDVNRVVYPLKGKKGMKVYSLGVTTAKEDIILLERPAKDTLELAYELKLGSGMEARLEADGSLCIYGISSVIGNGNVATGSEKDAELLQKAQQNAPKNRLIFRFPAPYVVEGQKKMSKVAKSWFELKNGKDLTLHTKGLHQATYPLSIDPTVYIETARKLMRGNNESNIDFDVANELIQKSQTTGARIDEWSGTTNLTSAVWGQGTAAAGGFIYSVGGVGSGNTVPAVYDTVGTSTFNVPSGVTAITIEAWGGGGGGGAGSNSTGRGGNGGGGGYAKAVIDVTPSESLNVDVGTGGAKASANGRGGNGGGFSAVRRSATYLVQAAGGGGGSGRRGNNSGTIGHGGAGGGATGQAATAGSTGGGGQGGTAGSGGTFGAGTGDGVTGALNAGGNGGTTAACATDATGTGGAGGTGGGGSGGTFTSTCAAGGGGGGGRYGGGGGGSTSTNNRTGGGGGGGSSYANPTGLVAGTDQLSVGTGQTPGNSADPDRGGLGDGGAGATTAAGASAGDNGIVVISYTTAGVVTDSVYWAQFNTSTNAIESPNPGNGVCSGWCTDTAYDLPDERQGLSLVAYNGFLYALGGTDSAGAYQTTVYIAKIGVNGEPQLWHPSGGTPVYWYADTALSNARSQFAATTYKNKMYIFGGLTTGSAVLSSNTVQQASINPTGTLTTWTTTGTQALGTARYGLTAQVYNDVLYVMGGNATLGGTPVTTVEYSKLTTSGNMNSWVATNSLVGGRVTLGGSFTTIFGGYIYLAGGCETVNASGYCTAVADDVQLASINADGSIAPWDTILNLTNDRFGHTLIAWQGGLYRLGGCRTQDTGSGACTNTVLDVDYGVINQDGDASTVSNSEPSGSTPCSGTNPTNCDLPPAGDSAGQGGQMSSMVVINNGYIYNIGGCVTPSSSCDSNMSGNVSYAAITSTGDLSAPPNCSGTSYGLWCVDSTNRINGTNGLGAAAATVFNNTIYIAGGTDSSNWQSNIYRVSLNTDGSLTGAWQSQTFNSVGMASSRASGDDARGYMYMFTRSNPSSAGTNPGNLYILGGCSATAGIGCSAYFDNVIKCNIAVAGTVNGCTESGQMQIDADNINSGVQGIGLMAGTVYANRLYLVGGACTAVTSYANETDPCASDTSPSITNNANRKETMYAKINDSNNIVDNDTGSSGGAWKFATADMDPVRRRAVSFGYNGYIYSLAGYSGAESLQDLLFSKIDVSTGDLSPWSSSGVVVTPRWDLKAIVSNGYVYAVGGCGTGTAPAGCSDMQEEIQTFQLYNNDSGSPVGYTASANQFGTDRFGASSAIVDGYLYVAGGCISTTTDCDSVTDSVQYTQIDANGNLSNAWSTGGNLPAGRAWGQLEAAGGTLYYIGGQTNTATDERPEIYWATPSAGAVSWAAVGGSYDLPDGRTQHSAVSWNNRIYVTGGIAETGGAVSSVVYVSPDLSAGGAIASAWSTTSSFNIARSGHSLVAYANNLYLLGGYDGTNYLSDTQFASIGYKTGSISQSGTTVTGSGTAWTAAQVGSNILYADGSTALITGYTSATSLTVDVNKSVTGGSIYTIQDGSISTWAYSTSLATPIRQGDAFAANGYMYLVGGRSSANSCASNTLVAPISANTTIATGNNPTGVGEWYETNQRYDGPRYGNAVAYQNGRVYVTGGVCDGFPSVASVGSTVFSTAATAHNVVMPSTVNSGDLLLTLFTNDMAAGGTTTTPSGWTAVSTQTSGNTIRGTVYAKVADGTEDGASVDFVTSVSEEAAAQVYRVPAGEWSGALAGVEAGNFAAGTTTTPNPPSLNPGAWGTENTLWLAYIAGSSYSSLTTLSTNHQGGKHSLSNTGTGGASVTSTWRESAAASEDPASPTMGSSHEGIAFTIAIRPAGFAKTGNNRTVQTAFYSQPQVAKYSRMIDTDTDVFPTSWLMNGIDNAIGARWQVKYRSMHDLDATVNPSEDCGTSATMPQMTTWGEEFDYGDVTLGDVAAYVARDGSGGNINCARYYYFDVSIDASQTFGYPEDVERGPTIADLSLFFTSDPSKRLKHGKTFTGGEQQPLDTPCRQSVDANCPLP